MISKVCLRHVFYHLIPFYQKLFHIPAKEKKIDYLADPSEGRFKNKNILHHRLFADAIKKMLVPHAFESALNHFVGKIIGVIKFSYFRSQCLQHTKMPCPPGNRFT